MPHPLPWEAAFRLLLQLPLFAACSILFVNSRLFKVRELLEFEAFLESLESALNRDSTSNTLNGVLPAFLFDLDGTLIDSVYQHVLAWREALERAGMRLSVLAN